MRQLLTWTLGRTGAGGCAACRGVLLDLLSSQGCCLVRKLPKMPLHSISSTFREETLLWGGGLQPRAEALHPTSPYTADFTECGWHDTCSCSPADCEPQEPNTHNHGTTKPASCKLRMPTCPVAVLTADAPEGSPASWQALLDSEQHPFNTSPGQSPR